VCQATGWTWDYVEDQVTVARLRALLRHWREAPPPPILLRLIAQALGVVPQRAATEPARAAWDELREIAADPRSGLALDGKPPA
jgi:hypothetical protein